MQERWIVLSQALERERKYFEDRLKPRLLSGRYYARRAVLRETQEITVGMRLIQAYAALWKTRREGWYEVGTVWVAEDLRSKGLQNELMREIVAIAPEDVSLFLITSATSIMRSAINLGFDPVTTTTMPNLDVWTASVGLDERLPRTALRESNSRLTEGERWLFVRRAK